MWGVWGEMRTLSHLSELVYLVMVAFPTVWSGCCPQPPWDAVCRCTRLHSRAVWRGVLHGCKHPPPPPPIPHTPCAFAALKEWRG